MKRAIETVRPKFQAGQQRARCHLSAADFKWRSVQVQGLRYLVHARQLSLISEANRSRIGPLFPENDIQQCCLARAVCAPDHQSISPADNEVEVAKQRPP